MQKGLNGLLVALGVAIMSTSAWAGGDSTTPVYTSYSSAPVQIRVVEPSQVFWVSAVNVDCCYCCCGSNVSVGGLAFETRAETHTLVVYQ